MPHESSYGTLDIIELPQGVIQTDVFEANRLKSGRQPPELFEGRFELLPEPQLPEVVLARVDATCRIMSQPFTLNLKPGFTCVYMDWRWWVEYPFNGRNDRSATRSGRVNGTVTITLDFGDDPQGGLWYGEFGGRFRHTDGWEGPVPTLKLVSSIRGTNPSKDEIRAQLGSIPAQVRAYKESRFRQFGPNEMPLFGPPRGFGVMQIDNPPATARQIWSWKENVDAGLALIAAKAREVDQHYRNIYNTDATIPRLTREQIKLAEYQWYNGGWYWGWDKEIRKWLKITSEPYADDALALEKKVEAGSPPSDW